MPAATGRSSPAIVRHSATPIQTHQVLPLGLGVIPDPDYFLLSLWRWRNRTRTGDLFKENASRKRLER